MKLPLISGAYSGVSKDTSSQELVNYFYEAPAHHELHKGSLVPAHGASLFATMANAGTILGLFFNPVDSLLYVVSGTTLYEVTSAGVATSRGTLGGRTPCFALDRASASILIVDGTGGWIFNYSANSLTAITDVDFPGVSGGSYPYTCAYIDGYFLVNDNNSGAAPRFRWSSLHDGLTWASGDFASVESINSSNLNQILVDRKNIYFFGQQRSEVWYHSEDPSAIFQRFEQLNYGTPSYGSSVNQGPSAHVFDNSIVLQQVNKLGTFEIIRIGAEYQPEVISTPELSRIWQQQLGLDYETRSYVYQIDGHEFYVFTLSSATNPEGSTGSTYVYDAATKEWHRRANSSSLAREKANCHAFCSDPSWFTANVQTGFHIIGDSNATGKLWEITRNTYTFEGSNMYRRITGPQISLDSESKLRFSELQVDFNEAEVSNGTCTLYWSKDGGTTWSTGRSISLASARAIVHKPGSARKWTFRIVIDSTEKVVIRNLYGRMYGEIVDGPNTKR